MIQVVITFFSYLTILIKSGIFYNSLFKFILISFKKKLPQL